MSPVKNPTALGQGVVGIYANNKDLTDAKGKELKGLDSMQAIPYVPLSNLLTPTPNQGLSPIKADFFHGIAGDKPGQESKDTPKTVEISFDKMLRLRRTQYTLWELLSKVRLAEFGIYSRLIDHPKDLLVPNDQTFVNDFEPYWDDIEIWLANTNAKINAAVLISQPPTLEQEKQLALPIWALEKLSFSIKTVAIRQLKLSTLRDLVVWVKEIELGEREFNNESQERFYHHRRKEIYKFLNDNHFLDLDVTQSKPYGLEFLLDHDIAILKNDLSLETFEDLKSAGFNTWGLLALRFQQKTIELRYPERVNGEIKNIVEYIGLDKFDILDWQAEQIKRHLPQVIPAYDGAQEDQRTHSTQQLIQAIQKRYPGQYISQEQVLKANQAILAQPDLSSLAASDPQTITPPRTALEKALTKIQPKPNHWGHDLLLKLKMEYADEAPKKLIKTLERVEAWVKANEQFRLRADDLSKAALALAGFGEIQFDNRTHQLMSRVRPLLVQDRSIRIEDALEAEWEVEKIMEVLPQAIKAEVAMEENLGEGLGLAEDEVKKGKLEEKHRAEEKK